MASRSGEQYQLFMIRADEALENRNLNVARFWYRKALELRPENADAKDGLQKVEDSVK